MFSHICKEVVIIANILEAIFRLTDEYTATQNKITKSVDNFEKTQNGAQKGADKLVSKFKNMQGGASVASSGIESLTGKVAKFVTASYLGKKAIDTMFSAIKTGAEKQVQLNTFQSLLNSDEAGKALYDYIQIYGKQKSILGDMGVANATKSFLPFTQDINQLQKLYQLTERLYARDPTQGSEGAVFAMKELISGDVMSARERFNISGISGAKIRDLANSGDINGTLQYLDDVFNRFGATQAIVDKNFTSLQTQATKFGNSVRSALGDESSPAVQNLSTMFQQLNADMDAGKFAPFFNLIGNGMLMIGNGLTWIAENGTFLIPVIGGLVTALIIFNTAMGLAASFARATGATIAVISGQWIIAAALIAGAAASIALSASLNQQNNDLKNQADSLSKSADNYKNALKNAPKTDFGSIPVEVANKSPISVKGEVEIEKESQKYLFDLAAQKAFATFNMQQVTPQVFIQNQTVTKVADLEEINQSMGDMLYQNQQTQAAGVYG